MCSLAVFCRPLSVGVHIFRWFVLLAQGMDTGAGMVMFDAPVTVAIVVSDYDAHKRRVEVFPAYSLPKYQVIF